MAQPPLTCKPGDKVEVDRGNFKHFGVCVEGNKVVHKGALDTPGPSQMLSDIRGGVMKDNLKDVVRNDTWRVNNDLDSKYKPRAPAEIVAMAESRVGKDKNYNLTSNNCEHFANELRYGKKESQQVVDVAKGGGKVLLGASTMGSASALGYPSALGSASALTGSQVVQKK